MTPLTESLDATLAADPPSAPPENPAGSITDALGRLPANQSEVIRLKFLHEMSYREISKLTGLSESHVGVLIHNGIKALRRHMAATSPERSLT